MKIQEVTIEGFQSHLQSTFSFSPGLTVITGPSDAGKTAIIRALRWFAFNEPTGEAFLHTIRNPDGTVKEAVDQARVTVTFEDGTTITKTRRKGKTTYTHSAYPSVWEKAEVPPEVKETLGLVKQAYGDFETCLNFAFQLDPPFMLSETASVGAKVLGKLAGTEVVDKAISEVNKKTHHTRNEISYAEKQIGEIDVSLTEYFDLDTQEQALQKAEEAFTRLQDNKNRRDELIRLMLAYERATENRITYFDRVEALSSVVVAAATLGILERNQKRAESLDSLFTKFWTALADQKEPSRVIRATEHLPETKERLTEVEKSYRLCAVDLPVLHRRHTQYEKEVSETAAKIILLNDVIILGCKAQMAEINQQTLGKLQTLLREYETAELHTAQYTGRLRDLYFPEDSFKRLLSLSRSYENTSTLQSVYTKYREHKEIVGSMERNLENCNTEYEKAQKELQEAWEESVGVCPLCGSEVRN